MRFDPAIHRETIDGKQTASTPMVSIGRHSFGFEHDEWGRINTLGPSPIIAFSRTPIEATFGLNAPTVLTGAVAATPPAGVGYVRSPRARTGHTAVWCSLNQPAALAALVAQHDPHAQDNPDQPFARDTTPASPLHALALHRLAARTFDHSGTTPLEIEEAVFALANEMAQHAAGSSRPSRTAGGATQARRRDAVNAACAAIAIRFAEPLSISDIAAGTGYSPAFLARCFRETTGRSMHEYLIAIRLREALDLLQDPSISITRAAMLTGFSSHAHLTATCVAKLGAPPSAIAKQF